MSFFNCKLVIVRKPRKCYTCLKLLPKGALMEYRSGYHPECRWWHMYMCECCIAFDDEGEVDWSEGVAPGEFLEYDFYKDFRENYLKTHKLHHEF